LPKRVPAVNRAPLTSPPVGTANIKALLSHNDWFADFDRDAVRALGNLKSEPRAVRRARSEGRGLVIIYPISKDSVPMGPEAKTVSRRDMQAPGHLMGIGLIFPELEREGRVEEGTYYSVHPDWAVTAPEEDDEVPVDNEESLMVDAERAAPRS
jgi:hypothetical protein